MIDYKKLLLLVEGKSDNLRTARNQLHILYEHLLKFHYAPHKQEFNINSWKTSIIGSWIRMMKSVKNPDYKRTFLNTSDFAVENEFRKGLYKAEEYNKEINFPQSFKEFYTLEDLVDINFLYNFFNKYSYTDRVRNYCIDVLKSKMKEELKVNI